MKAFSLLVALFCSVVARADVITFPLEPAITDPQIQMATDPHWIYIDRDIVVDHKAGLPEDRHQLLLWLDGTGGKTKGPQAFLTVAASLGYHVLNLMYPNEIPASICGMDRDPAQFESFRMALIQGGTASVRRDTQTFTISQTESIQNRLVKALVRLQALRPKENWSEYLNQDGSIKWESIAVAGQSQGGGHAALLGIKHPLARVLCFGAPKDYSIRNNVPAPWYREQSATPKNRFFAFNHHQDPKGCTPEQLLANLVALGLDAFGPIGEVDTEPFPYHHARVLYTSYPVVVVNGQNSEGAKMAHGSAVGTVNADRRKETWTYMLTEPCE